jgi:hypothetical protein
MHPIAPASGFGERNTVLRLLCRDSIQFKAEFTDGVRQLVWRWQSPHFVLNKTNIREKGFRNSTLQWG